MVPVLGTFHHSPATSNLFDNPGKEKGRRKGMTITQSCFTFIFFEYLFLFIYSVVKKIDWIRILD